MTGKSRANVPCDGCTACCRSDLIVLHPEHGDNPDDYQTQETLHPLYGHKVFALIKNERGHCIYLGEHGCTIHDRAPLICRKFDCRRWFKKLPRNTRRQLSKNPESRAIIEAGRARLNTLPD